MSFDLRFYTKGEKLDIEKVIYYLTNLSNFNNVRAKYETVLFNYANENTSVEFKMFYDPRNEQELATGAKEFLDSHLSFSINFNRPYFFAIEAMKLLENLANEFSLYCLIPQKNKLENQTLAIPAARELIESWDEYNILFTKTFYKNRKPKGYLEREKSLLLWKYLKEKSDIETSIGESDIYVPKIYVFKYKNDEKLYTVIIWPEAIDQVIPKCDLFFIGKNIYEWYDVFKKNEKKFMTVLTYDKVIKTMGKYLVPFSSDDPNTKVFVKKELKAEIKDFNKLFKEKDHKKFEDFEGITLPNFIDFEIKA